MAAYGNYLAVPRNGSAALSVANTNRDGTGTLATVLTGPARNTASDPPLNGGSRIDGLAIQAAGATTAGMVRLFVHDGANSRLVAEIPVQAVTPGAAVPAWSVRITRDNSDILPIILGAGSSLRASTHNAETFHVTTLQAGDF